MTKRIESVKYTDVLTLKVTFSGGEVRILDCTKKVQDWFRKNKKDLIKISENFNTAYVEDGNVAFKCGKEVYYISADDIHKNSYPVSEPKKAEKASRKTNRHATTTTIKRRNIGLGTISSMDVMHTVSQNLPFTGDWKEFLGEPSPNFYMILSAQPGHGKSTFCLKFGNYLTKFGRVLYITNEEDAGRIKNKLKFVGDRINDFDISFDTKNLDDVMALIEQGKYDFVFIDSAQYGGMDYKELRIIREKFPKIGMVAICRQTKSGTARGSQEKEYDGDITIKFDEPGHAITVKNRFWELADYTLF